MYKTLLLCLATTLSTLAAQDGREAPGPKQLEPTLIATHPEVITKLTVGVKGKVLYTADKVNSRRAWELKKERYLWESSPEPKMAVFQGFVAGEKALATCVGAPSYQLYDLKTGERTGKSTGLAIMAGMPCLAFDPKGKWLWLGSNEGGAVRLTPGSVNGWSKRGFPNGGTPCMALDSKAKQLALGGMDGTVRFIDPKSTQKDEDTTLEVHDAAVTALAFGPKGKLLLWNVEDASHPASLVAKAEGPVAGVHFLNKGKGLVTTTGGKSVQLWDLSELDG